MNMLARAFGQKAVCANCGKPHGAHHQHGACPLGDGSGYSLNSHYKRMSLDSLGYKASFCPASQDEQFACDEVIKE